MYSGPGLGIGIGTGLSWAAPDGQSYDPEASALFARMTVQPDATRKGLINGLIVDLKASTAWNSLDLLYVTAAHDFQAACLNWRQAAFDLVPQSSPTWVQDRYVQGDGSTSYFKTGFVPNANAVALSRDAAHLSAYLANNQTGPLSPFGARSSTSTNQVLLLPNNAGSLNHRINQSASGTGFVVSDSSGFHMGRRYGAGNVEYIRDNSVLIDSNTASAPVTAFELYLGGCNTAGSPTLLTSWQIAAATAGGKFTDNVAARACMARIKQFLTDIGAA